MNIKNVTTVILVNFFNKKTVNVSKILFDISVILDYIYNPHNQINSISMYIFLTIIFVTFGNLSFESTMMLSKYNKLDVT